MSSFLSEIFDTQAMVKRQRALPLDPQRPKSQRELNAWSSRPKITQRELELELSRIPQLLEVEERAPKED